MRGRDSVCWRETERGKKVNRGWGAERERETQRAVHCFSVVWHYNVLIAWPLSSACLVFGKWQVTSTLQGIALCSGKRRWIRSRCTVPLGHGWFKLKAQYSLSQSIGAQTVCNNMKAAGRRDITLVGGIPHSLGSPDGEKTFNRIEMKLN